MSVIFNRNRIWQQQLLGQVLHIIDKHLPEPSYRLVARELEDLFHCRGVWIVTEHDRARAGLAPRDAYGWTLEELQILENQMTLAMYAKTAALLNLETVSKDMVGNIRPGNE